MPVYLATANNPPEGLSQPCYTAKANYHIGIRRKRMILTLHAQKEQQSTVATYTSTEEG